MWIKTSLIALDFAAATPESGRGHRDGTHAQKESCEDRLSKNSHQGPALSYGGPSHGRRGEDLPIREARRRSCDPLRDGTSTAAKSTGKRGA
jgi:hypothetical protein